MNGDQGEEHSGEAFRKSMEASLLHLDHLGAQLKSAQEKLIDEQIKAREEIKRIEQDAHNISTAYMDAHRKEIEKGISHKVVLDITKKLIISGFSSRKVQAALELSPEMISTAWMELGFEKLDENHVGHVTYVDEGRSGRVIFLRDDLSLEFYYEFGAGNVLVYIDIPVASNWEKETGLPGENRMPILHFIAKRVVRDQAQDHTYRITDNSIEILRPGE